MIEGRGLKLRTEGRAQMEEIQDRARRQGAGDRGGTANKLKPRTEDRGQGADGRNKGLR